MSLLKRLFGRATPKGKRVRYRLPWYRIEKILTPKELADESRKDSKDDIRS